ncbi:hypothetical protein V6N13_130275 [Hibiscus sabdariffa]
MEDSGEFKTSNTNVVIVTSAAPSSTTPDKPTPYDKSNLFRPWMLVERRSQKNTIEQNEQNHCESGLNITESRFNPIFETSEPSSTTMDRPTTTTMSFTSEIVSAVTFMVKSHAHVSAIVPSVSLSGSSMYGPLVVPAAAAVFDTMSIPTPKVSTKLSVIEKKQSSQTTTLERVLCQSLQLLLLSLVAAIIISGKSNPNHASPRILPSPAKVLPHKAENLQWFDHKEIPPLEHPPDLSPKVALVSTYSSGSGKKISDTTAIVTTINMDGAKDGAMLQ